MAGAAAAAAAAAARGQVVAHVHARGAVAVVGVQAVGVFGAVEAVFDAGFEERADFGRHADAERGDVVGELVGDAGGWAHCCVALDERAHVGGHAVAVRLVG